MRTSPLIALLVIGSGLSPKAIGQAPTETLIPRLVPDEPASFAPVVQRAIAFLLAQQEGDQWPYDSGHRVFNGREMDIQIGYRVGGTSFCAMSMILAPGYAEDTGRQAAVRRATSFVVAGISNPLLAHTVDDFKRLHQGKTSANYILTISQRNWGYTFGLLYLLQLRKLDAVPEGMDKDVDAAIRFYLAGLAATEAQAKQGHGWQYLNISILRTATVVTAPTLQALFEAKRQGFPIDEGLVERGIQSLLKARTKHDGYAYAGNRGVHGTKQSSAGRMLVCESILLLAGHSDAKRVRAALDAFFANWHHFEARRGTTHKTIKGGTHGGEYGIAPYYFYYGHYYASLAIQLLPAAERSAYRSKLLSKLATVQLDDGTWNDRPLFLRRAATYGTAVVLQILTMPQSPPILTPWKAAAAPTSSPKK